MADEPMTEVMTRLALVEGKVATAVQGDELRLALADVLTRADHLGRILVLEQTTRYHGERVAELMKRGPMMTDVQVIAEVRRAAELRSDLARRAFYAGFEARNVAASASCAAYDAALVEYLNREGIK